MVMIDAVLEGFLNSIQSLHKVSGQNVAGYEARTPHRAADDVGRWNAGSCNTKLPIRDSPGVCGIGAKIGRQGRHVVITKVLQGGAAASSSAVFEGDIVEQVPQS